MVVVGVDEVGRGALVGDLVVAACCFAPTEAGQRARTLAQDSKAFKSRMARQKALEIMRPGLIYQIARRTPEDIDRLNIRGAVLSAFAEAALGVCAHIGAQEEIAVLWDGKDRPDAVLPSNVCESRAVIKGDATVPEIAAASMVAKVLRDEEMDGLALLFPMYDWEKNAGYGTAGHIAAIRAHGMCPHHRSWAAKFLPG